MMKMATALIQCMTRSGSGWRRCAEGRLAKTVACAVCGIGNSCSPQNCRKRARALLRIDFDDFARVLTDCNGTGALMHAQGTALHKPARREMANWGSGLGAEKFNLYSQFAIRPSTFLRTATLAHTITTL